LKQVLNKSYLPLFLILLLATFLRFYQLENLAPFLGDQGRDLLEIYLSLKKNQIPLVGPLSNQDVHGGPIYYYLLIPSLLISNFNPLYPTMFLTLFGLGSIFLLYQLTRSLWNNSIAILVSLVFAISSQEIIRSQGIWNPSPIPFFTLLSFWSVYQIQIQKKKLWFLILGTSLGIVTQLYSPAMFLLFPFGIWWLTTFFKKEDKQEFLKYSLWGLIFFFLTYIPFLIFQFQNDFIDFKNLTTPQEVQRAPIRKITLLQNFLHEASFNFANQFTNLTALTKKASPLFLVNFLLGIILVFIPLFKKERRHFQLALIFFLFSALGFFTLNPGQLPSHYVAFLWPIPFLFLANFFHLLEKMKFKKIIFLLTFFLATLNLYSYFNNLSPQDDLRETKKISQEIINQTGENPFSLLLDSNRSPSDAHFRYFLALENKSPISIDESQVLFLICDQHSCPSLKDKVFIDSYCLPRCPDLQDEKQIILNDWQIKEKIKIQQTEIVKLIRI